MFERGRSFSALMLLTAGATLCVSATAALAQRAVRKTVVPTPLSLNLTATPSIISSCIETASKVQLSANANAPADQTVRYRWSATAGHIEGTGPVVSWDLAGVQPGNYKALVTVTTGNAPDECESFSSIPIVVSSCAPAPPACPPISIECPDNLQFDQPLTFSANVTGLSPSTAHPFYWTTSAGTIIDGQGTSSIRVDTRGLGGQSVTATLTVQGYSMDCSASCSVAIPLQIPPSRRFDEFPNISRNDEKARLDNLAIALQNDPSAVAYVIVYPNRSGANGDVEKHTKRIVDYLVNSRGINAGRIMTLRGPARNELRIELWITPAGAKPPVPTP